MTHAAKCLAVLALSLCGCFASAALAQNAAPAGQSSEPPPVADAGTTAQINCIEEKDNYVRLGKGVGFQIELMNKCEQRLKCQVFVYINSAKGPAQGRGTIVLAPKSRGAAAKNTYTMKAKMNGGSSQSWRECKVF
jgi:hypothetical protein